MNRRKFLKFLAWLPLAPIAAKIPLGNAPKYLTPGEDIILTNKATPSGGYLTFEDLEKITNDHWMAVPTNEVAGYEMKGINYDAD